MFQVSVSSYKFTENHQIFTISHILREGDRFPHPEFIDNVSLICDFFFVCLGGVTMTMEMTTTVATQTVPVKVEVARLMELLGR